MKERLQHLTVSKILPLCFYGLLIVFMTVYLLNIDYSALSRLDIAIGFLVAALCVDLASRYWTVVIWKTILRNLGATQLDDKVGLLYVYAKSWLGRYIPGTAPWILGKIYFASKHGISKSKLAVSSLLEAALQVVVMIAFSLFALLIDSRFNVISKDIKLYVALAFILCLVILTPRVFNGCLSIAFRVLKRRKIDATNLATTKTIGIGAVMYLLGATLNGLVFFLIAKSISPTLHYQDIWFIMAVGNLSGALGMLAIFVPSGLGVREGVQLLLLSLVMPASLALIVTVVARILSIVSDLLFFALAFALKNNKKSV